MMAFCQCDLVLVGNNVAQIEGLPIGGVLSKTAASLVLGVSEHVWCENDTVLRTHPRIQQGTPGIKRLEVQGTMMIRA